MPKLDLYLRSIEKFGAAGAVLASGQAVTLRFPTGDRQATQVTPHEQIVQIVREIAPTGMMEQIENGRAARLEIDSSGRRYVMSVTPRGGAWQIEIAAGPPGGGGGSGGGGGGDAAEAVAERALDGPSHRPGAALRGPAEPGLGDGPSHRPAAVLRGPAEPGLVDGPSHRPAAVLRGPAEPGLVDDGGPGAAPAGAALEQLTRAARAASASDLYLSAGAVGVHRIAGEVVSAGTGVIDGDLIARELGAIAPPEARAAWEKTGTAMFTYGDGEGRVRVTLARDHRGPSAALRLLPDEAPPLDALGLAGAGWPIEGWLGRRGLIVIAGPSGSGKTVTLAALVRALGERRRRVVTIEEPIELVHASAWISQRAVGEHVASVSTAVGSAMNEGADAIAIGRVSSEATARGVVEAVSGGHLVLTTVVAHTAGVALDRMIAHLPADQRELAHGLLFSALLGTIQPVPSSTGERTFEITSPQT
jgi:twitching motility protein PilT